MSSPGWKVVHTAPDVQHIVPVGDVVVHSSRDDDGDCVCGPRCEVLFTDRGDVDQWTHHSLDGREARE